jgi:Domain of unknown function (DUF4440)
MPMQGNDAKRLSELEERRYQAMLDADLETLSELCSDNLLYTHSNGDRDDKASYLAKVRSGVFVYHSVAHPADRTLIANGTALISGRMTADVAVNGEMRHIDNGYLAVWMKEQGTWRFVAYQPTPLSKK